MEVIPVLIQLQKQLVEVVEPLGMQVGNYQEMEEVVAVAVPVLTLLEEAELRVKAMTVVMVFPLTVLVNMQPEVAAEQVLLDQTQTQVMAVLAYLTLMLVLKSTLPVAAVVALGMELHLQAQAAMAAVVLADLMKPQTELLVKLTVEPAVEVPVTQTA
jgi:hypothetical protein